MSIGGGGEVGVDILALGLAEYARVSFKNKLERWRGKVWNWRRELSSRVAACSNGKSVPATIHGLHVVDFDKVVDP